LSNWVSEYRIWMVVRHGYPITQLLDYPIRGGYFVLM
jgi:hypothetical protein